MKIKKIDFFTSIVLLGITAFFLYQTSLLQSSAVQNEMGPRFFPYVCLTAIGAFSIALLVSSLKTGKIAVKGDIEEGDTGEAGEGESQHTIKEAMIYFGMILLIIVGVYYLGFFPAMAIGIFGILWFTGWKPHTAGIFSVVAVAAVVFIFQYLIDIPLPKGVLF